MYKQVKKAVAALANGREAWVLRRDAAEFLGKTAGQALAALKAHLKDPDIDVRTAVERALRTAGADSIPAPPSGAVPLEDLARACKKKGQRTVQSHGDGYVVEVNLKGSRRQQVYLMPFERKDGVRLVRIFTYCGVAEPNTLEWALKANMKLTHGALGLATEDDEGRLVLVDSQKADEATPSGVRSSVKAIAFYGDWIEKKLTGLDDF